MNVPFTNEQFLDVFRSYNAAFRFMPILTYAMGITSIVLLLSTTRGRNRVISLIMAFFWLWNGAVYHFSFFRSINDAATVFAGLFVIQGLLFLIDGVLRDRIQYGFSLDIQGIIGSLFIFYAMIAYPILGSLAGHAYPASPIFGMAPCPTTIFTFGMILFARSRVPIYLIVIPLLWSVIGLSAAAVLGIYEDFGLTAAGLVSGVILIGRSVRSRRPISKSEDPSVRSDSPKQP
jgi:hypothetical protein